jgi:hypothetical protein
MTVGWVAHMADKRRRRGPAAPRRRPRLPAPEHTREIVTTAEFERWSAGLNDEQRAKLSGVLSRIVAVGSTLGRPHADVIHSSRVSKLKEARIGRGIRVLFAFDSDQNPVMLVGGDKTGKWNRWYPSRIKLAESLYLDHERSIGKEARWLSQRDVGRTSSQITR